MAQLAELFVNIADWSKRVGAEAIGNLEGCWSGETDDYIVKFNGHRDEVEKVPPFSALVESKKTGWIVALVGPDGGCVMGESEGDLIAHFAGANQTKN